MKKIYLFKVFVFLSVCIGCSKPRYEYDFEMYFQNNTNQELLVLFYNDNDDFDYHNLSDSVQIKANERKLVCDYYAKSFEVWGCYLKDQIIIRFPNNKGYYCDTFKETGKCFENTNRNFIQNPIALKDDGNNEYTFIITQEDYENAHKLPE